MRIRARQGGGVIAMLDKISHSEIVIDDDCKVATSDGSKLRAHWVAKILKVHGKTVAAIIEQGKTLRDAKVALDKTDQWMEIFERKEVPFSLSLAERFMRIARHPKLADSANWQILPAVVSSLYELAKLSDEEFERRKKDGTLHQDMTCNDVTGRIKSPKPLPPRETLLAEFKSSVDDLKQALAAGEIKVDDIRPMMSELIKVDGIRLMISELLA
jgi:hypothetical protein